MIPVARPVFGEEEVDAVSAVIRSGMIASGDVVTKFEDEYAEYSGVKHAIATSNGTTALHAGLLGAGILPGNEVIIPSFTFIATKDTYHLERGIQVAEVEPLDYPDGKESLFVLARHINDFMPEHMVTLLERGLGRVGKQIKGSKIALLGWSFLANTDDSRNTPSEVFYDRCIETGVVVRIHDPWVKEYPGVTISSDIRSVVEGADAIVIMSGHRMYFDLTPESVKKMSISKNPVIVDGRNVIDPDAFISSGFVYKGIGRGDKNSHPVL